MILALLHLSDIHISVGADFDVGSRATQIIAALQGADPLIEKCMLAVSGDIASSGKAQEYEIAEHFFGELADKIEKQYGRLPTIAVPGNHDCDLSAETAVRSIILDSIPTHQEKLDSSEIQAQLLTVQKEFFGFLSRIASSPIAEPPWVAKAESFPLGSHQVRVVRLNTAAMSKLHETQGKLYFPTKAAQKCFDDQQGNSLVVTVFHHPYNWLEDANSLALKELIENGTDIVLTGHRHVEGSYTTELVSGQRLEYVEGAVFYSPSSQGSGFNVILCNLDERIHKVLQFRWDGEKYSLMVEGTWKPFLRNDAFRRRFENNSEFTKQLNEAGMGFTHPRREKLYLEDIFVYPDLQKILFVKDEDRKQSSLTIASIDVPGFIRKQDDLLVVGWDQSGRSALARMLYKDLHATGLVPVLLEGKELKAKTPDAFLRAVYESYSQQYSASSIEAFKQLPPERKVLIIDDWHCTKFSHGVAKEIINLCKRIFHKLVVLSADIFRVEEIAIRKDEPHPFVGFEYCEIRAFSNVLRGRLIERWLSLGRDGSTDDPALARELSQAEHTIRALLGKQLLPSCPFVVIALLQAYESAKDSATPSGSYGYLYEVIITKSIARVSKDVTMVDLNYVVLSRLAYYLFETEKKRFTLPDMRQVVEEYRREYDILLNAERLLDDFQAANLIVETDGNFEFRYKYAYYYFVARYIRDAMRVDARRDHFEQKLVGMADRVYYDEYMNVLMFVLYLTRDAKLIWHIVDRSKHIYGTSEPCDFDSHIQFINKLYSEAPKLILPSASYQEARERERQHIDEDEVAGETENSDTQAKNVIYNDGLQDVVKLNIAFKTLQLMGQILRNFPGSLESDVKLELTTACYLLGLRAFRAILALPEQNLEEFRNQVAEIIRQYKPLYSDQELARTTDEAILWLTRRCAFGMMKRISYSVGLEILAETYKRVLEAGDRARSFRIIDLAVKLDHFSDFPRNDLEEMWDELEKDGFCQMVIRDLVVNHLYLFPVADRTKQSVCTLLGIKFQRALPQR